MTEPAAGRIVRRGIARHKCHPPEHAVRGDVYRCACGRRWTCVNHVTERPGLVTMRADWLRRYWPWPR